jgi:hypothetical protein
MIRIFVLILSLLISSCQHFVTNSGFAHLKEGMSREEFLNFLNTRPIRNAVGGQPNSTQRFKHGPDTWEVWVFKVYDCSSGNCIFDHYEHVGLKNDKVEEWGTGELPITIRQNPNQFEIDVNHN